MSSKPISACKTKVDAACVDAAKKAFGQAKLKDKPAVLGQLQGKPVAESAKQKLLDWVVSKTDEYVDLEKNGMDKMAVSQKLQAILKSHCSQYMSSVVGRNANYTNYEFFCSYELPNEGGKYIWSSKYAATKSKL